MKTALDIFKDTPRLDPEKIQIDDIPVQIGLYAWIRRRDNKISYIGSAIGAGGLRKRIYSQHLNPKYLEARKERFNARDSFQVNHPVSRNHIVICKSAFRKNVAREHFLRAGEECVGYIKKSFLLTFVSFRDNEKKLVKDIEEQMISNLGPAYNIQYNVCK